MTCPHCQDTGWVCEAHPDKAFEGLTDSACDCGGAGMVCRCTLPSNRRWITKQEARERWPDPTEYQRLNFGPELT